jgi:hypothetical protein
MSFHHKVLAQLQSLFLRKSGCWDIEGIMGNPSLIICFHADWPGCFPEKT